MDVAFIQPRAGDPDELGSLAQLFERGRAGIAHRRLNPADQLVEHVARRALVRDLVPFQFQLTSLMLPELPPILLPEFFIAPLQVRLPILLYLQT